MALTLTPGDKVFFKSALWDGSIGQQSPAFSGSGLPIMGIVEDGTGPKIAWPNGVRQTAYASAPDLLFAKMSASATVAAQAFYHKEVLCNEISDDLGSSKGVVIGVMSFIVNDGDTEEDFALVQFEYGDTFLCPTDELEVIASNPNILG